MARSNVFSSPKWLALNWIFSGVVTALGVLLLMPTLGMWWYGTWFTILFLGILSVISLLSFTKFSDSFTKTKRYPLLIDLRVRATLCVIPLLIMLVVAPLTSFEIGRSDRYRALLGPVETSQFAQDIAPVDPGHVRIVDHNMALKLGSKRIGEDPGLGSRVELGAMDIQQVRGELYWVAPLLHKSFARWWTFSEEGTPGYVMVSAVNPDDVRLVQKIGDTPIHIRYQPNAYFSKELERHLYFNGFATRGLTDFTFEIDDSGKPFYVATIYERKIGFSGEEAVGVAVVDVDSGAIQEYTIANAPSWIDRIQPEDFVKAQIDWWGEYVQGWWNAAFAKDKVLKSSGRELRLVFGQDGKAYWYSGLTSKGSDNSTTGFMLIDSRTKAVKHYEVSGATEGAAQGSAEGATQEKRYHASSFILYNVAGKPTYIGPLKDGAGLVKAVAMVSVENYDIVGIGATPADALRSYRSALASRGNGLVADPALKRETFSGSIVRFGSDTRGNQTFFHFTLSEKSGYMFVGTSSTGATLPVTKQGDSVTVTYTETGSGLVDIESFSNDSLQIKNSVRESAALNRASVVRK